MHRPGIFVRIALMATLALLVTVTARADMPMRMHEEPKPVANVSFIDGDGVERSLQDFAGKLVLLNVWATWCGPCREEMPTLDNLQSRLGSGRFEVVALSIDQGGAPAVSKFFEEIGIGHLALYVDSSTRAARQLNLFGLPGTLLIGPDGKELGRYMGPAEWDTPEMVAFIQGLLVARAPTGVNL